MDLIIKYAPTIGLIFFFVAYLFILIAIMKPSAKKNLDEFAKTPLREE